MSAPTEGDWGKIHAKAWTDPEFRKLLETDPTRAVREYGNKAGKRFEKILHI
jgi:hypothetical protein